MAIDFDRIINQFMQAQTQANAANERRYAQLLNAIKGLQGRTEDTYGEILNRIESTGQVARRRAQQSATRAGGQAEQDLISRGLGNTTIRAAVQRGIGEDLELQQQAIDEQQALMQAQALEGRTGADRATTAMLASAIEGRSDVGPDMGQYASLLRQAASAGDQKPLSAVVGRGPSPGGGGGVSYGDRGSKYGGGFSGAVNPSSGAGSSRGGSSRGVFTSGAGAGGPGSGVGVIMGTGAPPVDPVAQARANLLKPGGTMGFTEKGKQKTHADTQPRKYTMRDWLMGRRAPRTATA
jgi:hypothetical protein